jgi:hypothetical protein
MAKKATARSNKSRSQLTKADIAAIKREQAPFIEKIRTAQLNEHQQRIYEAAQSGQGRYVVLAGPGSGKTFTSIKASTCFTGKSIYFSYNKKIQIDTNDKLVAIDSPMIATTAHAFGLSCLMGYTRGQCKVDDDGDKYRTIVKQYIADHWERYVESIRAEIEADEDADVAVMRLDAESWSLTLIHYAMVSLTKPTPAGLSALVDDFDLEDISQASLAWDFVCALVPFALEEGLSQFLGPEHLVVFDEMVYLPNVIEGVPIRKYDHVVVDEAQDTSRAALELMLKACHAHTQVFFIGDPRQGIYAFAGADYDSINRIIARLNAQRLPLRIVFRCGEDIVDLANQLCEEDEQLISAGLHKGKVDVLGADEYLERLKPGDAVIGRTKKRLVQGCLKVLQTGKKAKVLGKDLGANIAGVVTRLEAMTVDKGTKKRGKRVPLLQLDLSNLLTLLDEYKKSETEVLTKSRKHPEMAIAELEDRVETVRAFFEAYTGKCYDPSLRVPEDPKCAFNLFMTAHKSKGGEWENVYLIGTEEFPHPRAKSERQKQQERNLMYVAVTRAIENLVFIGAPFACLKVPGYEPERGLTIISFPAAGHLEIHPDDRETVKPSIYEGAFEEYEPSVVDTLFQDSLSPAAVPYPGGDDSEAEDQAFAREILGKGALVPADQDLAETVPPFNSGTVIDGSVVVEQVEPLAEGRVSRIAAIEVLCPACNNPCVNREGSSMITYELVGHTVTCSVCQKACIVPLNAFSLRGDVVAREKPAGQATKREKKGRTPKERKSKAGRKTKGKAVRQPMQLSLDIRVINTLNAMGVNKSELFEELLRQYEPFLEVWEELGNEEAEEEDDEEFDHDEMEL